MHKFYLTIFILTITSCSKPGELITFEDLATVKYEREDTLTANGSDSMTFKVLYNEDASKDLIVLNVSTSNATIIENENKTKYTVPVINDSNDSLFSEFTIKSTTNFNPINVEFEISGYTQKENIQTKKSIADSLSVYGSSFSVDNNYQGEITITGIVRAENNEIPSSTYKVIFNDKFLNGDSVNGEYRNQMINLNENGEASVIYTPGLVDSNTYIILIGEVVEISDEDTTFLGIKDELQIYVK